MEYDELEAGLRTSQTQSNSVMNLISVRLACSQIRMQIHELSLLGPESLAIMKDKKIRISQNRNDKTKTNKNKP